MSLVEAGFVDHLVETAEGEVDMVALVESDAVTEQKDLILARSKEAIQKCRRT